MVLSVYVVFAVIILITAFFIVKTLRTKTRMGNMLAYAMVSGLLVLVSFFLNCVIGDEMLMMEFCSLAAAFTDWSLYFLLMFIAEFVGRRIKREMRLFSACVFIFDSVLLITNPINNFLGRYEYVELEHVKCSVMVQKELFVIHIALCYCVVATMIILLVDKIIKTSRYYRLKYFLAFGAMVLLIVVDTYYKLSIENDIDYSKVFYSFAAIVFYYSAYSFSPRQLTKSLQEYVNDNISDAMIMYDNEGSVLRANQMARNLISEDIIVTKDNLFKYLDLFDEDDSEGEVKVRREIASYLYDVTYNPIYDRHGTYLASTFIFHDVTQVERRLEREHEIATMDPLTRSFNRTGFFEAAREFLDTSDSDAGYTLMINGINNFKGINGLYGTKAGDTVLIKISRMLHDYHHEFPMIYGRTAEGKFAMLLPTEYVDEIVSSMTTIPMDIGNDNHIHVDLRHGFVLLEDRSKPLEYYYERALLALARCKNRGQIPVVEFTAEMQEEIEQRELLLSEMHDAIERKEFFIELQPQIDLNKNVVCGAEALVRWNHPTLGKISPGEFIPLFETNGFITEIDRFVWNEVAELIKRFSEAGYYNGPVSVNVSQVDITTIDVARELEAIVNKYEIPVNRFHVEITESACVDNRDALIRTMSALRSKGFIVEIDDFGSGYSSLNALVDLPFDVVKLDMMFMRDKAPDEKGSVIVSSMTDMIHKLNAKIIAEGVETGSNVETARKFNVDVAQGYHYSRPLSLTDFLDYVKQHC